MELSVEDKIKVVQDRIQEVAKQKYGYQLDHEVQTIISSNPEQLKRIETALAHCIQALRILNKRLEELQASAVAVEHVNGKEKEHADVA